MNAFPPKQMPAEIDLDAFEKLVRKHHRQMMGYAFAICQRDDAAKDIVQESFVAAWTNIDKFDISRDFGTWIRGIIRNKAKEWQRSQNMVALDHEILDIIDREHAAWETEEDCGRLLKILSSCIQKLPERLHLAIDHFYFHQMSGDDTAKQLDSSPATIRKRLERARSQLKVCINETLKDTD